MSALFGCVGRRPCNLAAKQQRLQRQNNESIFLLRGPGYTPEKYKLLRAVAGRQAGAGRQSGLDARRSGSLGADGPGALAR
jgi:hypothetical protein